jgi:GT2 family glycosyltransferase
MPEIRIASVTVAYNGARVLPAHLNALRRQSHKLSEIVVVNNASTDETVKFLGTDYPEVTVLNQSENRGVGGGFAAGLDYAANLRKHEWIWLFDQDSVPADDSLERLIEARRYLSDSIDIIAILAPVCVHPGAKLDYSASLWRNGLQEPSRYARSRHISFVDSVISSGTLLRREPVEEVGLPRADFFMDFVDHEYCLRLRRYGYKIAVISDSKVNHTIGRPVKTSILGLRKVWTAHVPWREYYRTRNEIFTVWKYHPDWRTKSNVIRRLLRHALGVLLFGRQKLACVAMMSRGVLDGYAGRLGIRSFDNQGPKARAG